MVFKKYLFSIQTKGSRGGIEKQKNLKNIKVVGINPTSSVVTLHVDGLNTLVIRQRLAEWILLKTPWSNHVLCKETHFTKT